METRLLVDGRRVPGEGDPIEIVDPASGAVVAAVPAATPAQVDGAVAAATAAFGDWRDAPQEVRSEALRRIATGLVARREELARLLTVDTGRPMTRNLLYVDLAVTIFRQYAEMARVLGGRLVPANDPGQLSLTVRVPYGVVACLVPWNYPLDLLAFKVAPALATGNTVVVKGAPETTLSTLALGETFADSVPRGVVNLLAGGRDVGERLVAHPGTDLVAFTGSTAAGRAIGEACGRLVKPTHLELGGKDPAIVLPDVDPRLAARGIVWAAMLNAGQVCTSTERAYVHRSVYEEVVSRAVALAAALRVGDPVDPRTEVGPMRTPAGRARVLRHLRDALAAGATILTGGEPLDRPGFFMAPTVVVDVDHDMELMREETFGPVLPMMPFDEVDEALALAADTPYGLGASLYTKDPTIVERAARELRVGGLWVNDPVVDNPAGLLAGVRASGNGRELGIDGLHAFTTVRHVHWSLDLQARPWWYPQEGRDRDRTGVSGG